METMVFGHSLVLLSRLAYPASTLEASAFSIYYLFRLMLDLTVLFFNNLFFFIYVYVTVSP